MQKRNSNGATRKQQVSADSLPHNKDAEKALLGSILINNDSFFDISGLTPDMFYYTVNKQIYEAISTLSLRGSAVDPITVIEELEQNGIKDFGEGDHGPEAYMAHLLNTPTSSMYATDYAEIVRQNAIRRNIIIAANDMATSAWNGKNFQQVIDTAQSNFMKAVQGGVKQKVRHIGAGVDRYVVDLQDRILDPKSVPGLKTGFLDLDRVLNGLKPQELFIIAGRPGMGKTAMMMAMVDYMSVRRFDSLAGVVFSLEMSEQELINRLISRRTGINAQALDRGDVPDDKQPKAYEEAAAVKRSPIYISDAAGLSVAQMVAESTRIKMLHGLDYIMVDFLQLADAGGNALLYEKVSKIARDLKNLAKQLEVPVIALSQLNRSVESRPNKRPVMADLRDSGQIEEAADAILGLYRSDYYEEGVRPNVVEVIVLKQRNGPANVTIDLYFDGPTTTMHNLERKEPPF